MRLDHPIFQGPVTPRIELGSIATPGGYRSWERELPAKLQAWTVQQGELGKSVDYGLVSEPYGFEDSPDAEWISGGVNSKGPRSVALGRQGNWFLWGFAGDPSQMTESARAVFLNTIVWMKQFDGKAPVVALQRGGGFERRPAREKALVHVNQIRAHGKESQISEYLRRQFPSELWERTGGEPDALEAYYREHFEWLRPVKVPLEIEVDGPGGTKTKHKFDAFVLDADPLLAELAVSNRKPEFFEEFERLLGERGAEDATVKELAEQYLPPDAPREAAAFEEWVAKHRGRLFFSDVYGYRWYLAPEGVPPRPTVDRAPTPAPTGAGG